MNSQANAIIAAALAELERSDPEPPHYMSWTGTLWQTTQYKFWGALWGWEIDRTHKIQDSFVYRRYKAASAAGQLIKVLS